MQATDDSELRSLRETFDHWLRRATTFPGAERQEDGPIVRYVLPPPRRSFVMYSDLTGDTADAAIAAQLDFFAGQGAGFDWKVFGHDRPTDLGDRLLARGFTAEEPGGIMVLATDRFGDAAPPVAADIRRLTAPEQLVDVQRVLEDVWEEDFAWVHGRIADEMALPDYLSVYVAYVDELPASVAWVHFPEGPFATLWAGSTVAAQRGKGLYGALLQIRISEARARGKRYVTVDAGAMSRPIVERYGFRELTTATWYAWAGPETPHDG